MHSSSTAHKISRCHPVSAHVQIGFFFFWQCLINMLECISSEQGKTEVKQQQIGHFPILEPILEILLVQLKVWAVQTRTVKKLHWGNLQQWKKHYSLKELTRLHIFISCPPATNLA